jgi:predicted nucleic acid-binding protein
MVSKVFLDANVLLEVLMDRPRKSDVRKYLLKYEGSLFVSALSAYIVYYIGIKVADLPALQAFLSDYEILPTQGANFEWAFQNARNSDFEDALQVATALKNGCDLFLTLDKKLASAYGNLPSLKVVLV